MVVLESKGQKQIDNNDFITVDIIKNYFHPKRELILQNFMDVEYIALETNDDDICEDFDSRMYRAVMYDPCSNFSLYGGLIGFGRY